MKSIIVGTAGHIDHGKTALVRALTGVDADRLPEEKRRGITIDLGFAELELDGVRLGFIDVPGHERFVKNMLAGAHGIDVVALVIAADEGVMPQTREHFDICRLLGVRSGMVCLTKADMVDTDLLDLVRAEAEELIDGSFLEGAPVLAVSARTGFGVEELKAALARVASQAPARSLGTIARLPVDRVFTMRGFGAVVTGTLVAGEITEGDEMELLPAGARVRVRGLQVHNSQTRGASAGQRVAVNLGGIEAAQIERGMVLAPPGRLRPTQILDARIDVLAGAPRPLRTRMRVRVHLGAAEILARLRVLEEAGEIAPGKSGFAQLRLESPVAALPHERFIIRSYSPSQTIAGGRILDAQGLKVRGRDVARARERLARLADATASEEFALFVETAGAQGLRRADAAARTGWTDEVLEDAAKKAAGEGTVVDAEGVFVSRESFERISQATLGEIAAHHKREPLSRGLPRETLREQIFSHSAPEVFRSVMTHLEKSGALVSEKEVVRASAHKLSLSSGDTALRDRLEKIYKDAALEPPTLDEALDVARGGAAAGGAGARSAREHERKIFQLLLDSRSMERVGPDLFFHREALDRLVEKLREHAAGHGPERLIDVATFKTIAGVTRKYAIPLLEYFDRERITRRAGDKRIIL
jgi:selenocysteine-specific elongation factor